MARRVLLFLFVVTLSSAAFAGRIQISDPTCVSGDTDVTQFQNGFSFIAVTPDGNGNQGNPSFCNKTGQALSQILIAVPVSLDVNNYTCDPGIFKLCEIDNNSTNPSVPTGQTYISFASGIFPNPAYELPKDNRFTVDLTCTIVGANCSFPWPTVKYYGSEGTPGINGGQAPNPIVPTPEPASLALLGSGVAALLIRRKRA